MAENSITTENKSAGGWILYLLAVIGIVLMIKRFKFGIGSVANLNDAYPWGFWIGLDILTGVALAAGGFTLTAAIYIWGNQKYHSLARPAILTALLGYVLFVFALVVDLGRGPVMWHMFLPWMWQHDSVMFEVGWCVATYLTILVFEFLPSILEKFQLTELLKLWRSVTPLVVIVLLTLFTYAMTSSFGWAIAVFAITVVFELTQLGKTGKSRNVPVLLIMAGVLLSCLHQSSLGSLYLIVPYKLHSLWYTPMQPFVFLASAIMIGPAMVIFEGLVSARIFRRKSELELLSGLSKVLPTLLSIYLLVRIAGIIAQEVAQPGAIAAIFTSGTKSLMFWVELAVGVIIPLILLRPKAVRTETNLFWGSLCMIVGLFIHRFNVSVTGIHARGWQTYSPAWSEILISAGIISIGLLVFGYIVRNFPVYEKSALKKAG
jgi:formate dehydrogenase iron-sulfur subunit